MGMLTGVKHRFQVELRDWLANFLGVRRLERQHDALAVRMQILEEDIRDLHDDKDVKTLRWSTRVYTDERRRALLACSCRGDRACHCVRTLR